MNHRVIKIDPYNETVTYEYYHGYKSIYNIIKADLFDIVRVHKSNDVFVDDEGLLKLTPESKFFLWEGYPQPLAGIGMVAGNDGMGETVATTLSVNAVKDKIQFLDMTEARAVSLEMEQYA